MGAYLRLWQVDIKYGNCTFEIGDDSIDVLRVPHAGGAIAFNVGSAADNYCLSDRSDN